ncbi:succinate dehydrogenase iron-sulfur subunit [bacterium]|nr:succinate dehydrogenase iron-sulfur subunit [bacterium]
MPKLFIKIKRQDTPEADSYWEDFKISHKPGMSVISVLKSIEQKPLNARGEEVAPVVFSSSCHQEACGLCTMVINGRVQNACSVKVDELSQPISIEPLKKFKVERDLVVQKLSAIKPLKELKAWLAFDGTYDVGEAPIYGEEEASRSDTLSTCIRCMACLEVCPRFNERSAFVGAMAIASVSNLSQHPVGDFLKSARLEKLLDKGGLYDCDNVGNCQKACPKNIPLFDVIVELKKDASRMMG